MSGFGAELLFCFPYSKTLVFKTHQISDPVVNNSKKSRFKTVVPLLPCYYLIANICSIIFHNVVF